MRKLIHCTFFVCKNTAPRATERPPQLMEWNSLRMVIYLSLETICLAVVCNPKEIWNGSKGSWNVADILTNFKIEILFCKIALIITIKFIIKRGEKSPLPSETKITLYLLVSESRLLSSGIRKENWYLQTAIIACSCSRAPEKFHCWLWGKVLKILTLRTGHKDNAICKKIDNCWFKVFECSRQTV